MVSRLVSSFETTCQKSQYQSQNLRLISKVSVSVSNFETAMQKSQSQNAMDGLAHHRFWDPQRKLISRQVIINFYVRMCVQGHMKLHFFFKIKSLSISLNVWDWWWSQSQSQFLRPKTKVSVSVSILETIFIKSQSQNLIPILKVSVSVSKIETGYTESQSQSWHAKTGLAHPWLTGTFITIF